MSLFTNFFSREGTRKHAKKKKSSLKYNRGVLPSGGRSSVEDTLSNLISGIDSFYGVVEPDFPVEYLHIIDYLSIYHPDISKAVSDMVSIANSGHEIEAVGKSDNEIMNAMARISSKAANIYPYSAGVDGLINQYIRQLFCFGALSSEDVIQPDFAGVERVVTVPVRQIRFKRKDGEIVPYQQTSTFIHQKTNELGLVELNLETYRYYALFKTEKTPYGISALLSALMPLGIQSKVFPNLDSIMKNMRLLGLNIAKIPPPPEFEADEDPDTSRQKYQAHIQEFVDILGTDSYKHGFMGVPLEIEFENFPINPNMKGMADIGNMINRYLYTGIKSDAGLHNDHVSRTETFLLVIYKIFLHFALNIRNIVKRRVERTYLFDLLLADIPIESISLSFNKDSALKPYVDRLAERTHSGTVLNLLKNGVISPPRAANLLNEKEFYDEDLFYKSITEAGLKVKKFSWIANRQKYMPVENPFEIQNYKATEDTEITESKELATKAVGDRSQKTNEHEEIKSFKKEDTEKERAEKVREKLNQSIEQYLKKVLPYFDELGQDVTDYAAGYCQEHIEEISENSEVLKKAVIEYIREHPDYKKIKNPDSWLRKTSEAITIKAGKDWLEKDDTIFGGKKPDVKFVFGEGDRNAMKFYSRLHTFFFSSFIDNKGFGSKIDGFVNGFLERGEALYGGWTDAIEKEFNRLFADAIQGDFRFQVERIVNTGMANIKNRSHVIQLDQAGFKKGRINGYLETDCKICKPLHTKLIEVSALMKQVTALESAETPEAALEIIKKQNVSIDEAKDIKALVKAGKGLPPYHPNCKCFVEGHFED
jgi:hypothetical protein